MTIPEGWKQTKLGSLFKLGSGSSKPNDMCKICTQEQPIPVYGGNGIMGYSSSYIADGENIVIGRVGEYCGAVHYIKGPCWITDNALMIKEFFEEGIPKFFAYLLKHLDLGRLRNKGGQPLISQQPIYDILVHIPNKIEQQGIVAFCEKWDKAIDLTEQLIAAKLERQTWLLQQLLSGKLRAKGFSKKWSIKTLGDLVEPTIRSIAKPTEPYKALGIRSHCKGTFERFVDDPTKVDMEELFVARRGDLIVNITFAWEGAIAFVPEEHDGHLVSHRFPTYCIKEDEVDHDFLRYVVTQPRFIFTLILISPGGAGRNRVMSKRDFLNIEVSVPCLDEQRKIGRILKLADSEIDLHYKKLGALREQKKGLMQQLLTGKCRVKI